MLFERSVNGMLLYYLSFFRFRLFLTYFLGVRRRVERIVHYISVTLNTLRDIRMAVY
jgi:hypothetical protein